MKKHLVRNLDEVMRDEMTAKDRILALVGEEPRTVPEMADALGFPVHEVMLWVMAMWRYGRLVQSGKADEDGYYRYVAKE